MTFAWVLFVLECAVIAVNSGFLVWHEEYEDGIIGRVALGLALCLPCTMVFLEALLALIYGLPSVTAGVPTLTVWFSSGTALFLVRHTKRWWDWHMSGRHQWQTKAEPESRRKALAPTISN